MATNEATSTGVRRRGVGALTAWASASGWRRAIVVMLVAIALLAPGVTAFGPTDRDEARFAQATKQMLETGDFVDIRFQDDPRHKKPAGIYWAQAATASAFGGSEAPIWAYRLPSLIAAVMAALLTVWAMTPLVGARASFVAGVMTAALGLLSFEARTGKTDAFLLAAIIAAMGALARLWFGRTDDAKERGWNVFFFWTAMGVGVLIKGPIIFMPVAGVIAWMCIRERSLAGLRYLGFSWGLPWMLLLAAPWFIAIAVKTDGAFFLEAIGKDLVGKIGKGQESHGAPPGYYLALFWGTFWPWTGLALLAIPHVWNWRRAPETAFLLGWIIPTWIVFELVATKLPHYVLPVYPAICALAAAAALDGGAKPKGPLFWIGAIAWALPAFGFALALAIAPSVIEGRLILEPAIGGGVALLILLAAWRWLIKGVWLGFVRATIVAAIVGYGTAYHFALPQISAPWSSQRLAALAEPYRACLGTPAERARLSSVGYKEPSLVFLAGTDTDLTTVEKAAQRLATDQSALVWVEARFAKRFASKLAADGLETTVLARTSGFNYNGRGAQSFALHAGSAAFSAASCPAPHASAALAAGSGDRS